MLAKRMEHMFDIDHATTYGVHEAIIIRHLQFWVIKNMSTDSNYHDGHWWVYTTADTMAKVMPYLSARQIRYAVDKLVGMGVLLTGNFSEKPLDKTRWYAFADEAKFSILQNCQMHVTKLSNACDKIVKSYIEDERIEDKRIYYPPPTAGARERLKNWIDTSDLGEWSERKMFEYGCEDTLQDIVNEFYDEDFTVRERCERNERMEVLKHYQAWLPKYLKKRKDEAIRNKSAQGNDTGESLQDYEPCSTE